MQKKKQGISLIVLVITIIVMIILAAAIILSLNNAGIIGNANQAVFKQNVKNYLNELDLYYAEQLIDNGSFNARSFDATDVTTPSIRQVIPSMEKQNIKFEVLNGELYYIGANRDEYEWCRELGIGIDSTKLSQAEYETLYAEEIAYANSVGGFQEDEDPDDYIDESGYAVNYGEVVTSEVFVIPYGYQALSPFALSDNSAIKEIILPCTVEKINGYAFSDTGIERIVFPERINKIYEGTFLNCTSLKRIDIPEGVDYIGEKAFKGCNSLKEVNISKNVTYMGKGPFSDCINLIEINVEKGNTKYESEEGILYNAGQTVLINIPAAKTGTVVIPNTVTEIGSYAALGCKYITNIQIPEGVKKIGMQAFQYCESLKSVNLPDTIVDNLESGIFGRCSNLSSVKLSNNMTEIPSTMFYECKSLKNIVIPQRVKKIEMGAFQLSGLETIRIPSSVNRIEQSAFSMCSSLKTVYIEAQSLTTVQDYAFTSLAANSTIYVRNAEVANKLSGKYTSVTKISDNYAW